MLCRQKMNNGECYNRKRTYRVFMVCINAHIKDGVRWEYVGTANIQRDVGAGRLLCLPNDKGNCGF